MGTENNLQIITYDCCLITNLPTELTVARNRFLLISKLTFAYTQFTELGLALTWPVKVIVELRYLITADVGRLLAVGYKWSDSGSDVLDKYVCHSHLVKAGIMHIIYSF